MTTSALITWLTTCGFITAFTIYYLRKALKKKE